MNFAKNVKNNPSYQPFVWLLAYLVLHLCIRLLFSQTLQVDDAEQIRHAQELLLGYPIPQPPLYSWLSWGMFKIFGTGLFALTLLKYTLITLTFWFTWLVSSQLFRHLQTRYIATFSYLLMPSFAWHMHQGFTHTILLSFGIILSLHALLNLKDNPNIKNYVYLGFALSVGLMAKYSFLLFMIPLFAAAISISSFRKIIINQKILLAIGVFVLIVGPNAYWLTQHYQEVFLSIDQKLKVTSDNLLLDRIKSVGQFTGAAITFVLPFSLIFLINSWKKIFNTDKQTRSSDSSLLLSRFYLFIVTSVILLAIFVSMPHFKVRWFHPLMMIFPLWMLVRIERRELLSESIIQWFYKITILFTVAILSIRIMQVSLGPILGSYGRLNYPIIETLEKLPSHLLSNSILKTEDEFLGAHLLSHYQNNVIVIVDKNFQKSGASKTFIFRKGNIEKSLQCLWLWTDEQPDFIKVTEFGELTTMIGNKQYALYYALLPKKECN
jgi:4-amino-4-deoxy-L-arabinose transferase-like glycosyltransferase